MSNPEMSKPATPDIIDEPVVLKDERAELVSPTDVLRMVEQFAHLKREDLEKEGPITDEDWEIAVSTHLADIYTALFPPKVDETPTPSPITSEALLEAQQAEMDFGPVYEALSRLVLPGTNIRLFHGGGSLSVFGQAGELRTYAEVRKGIVYGTVDAPFNCARYTVAKSTFIMALRKLGRTGTVAEADNNELICRFIGLGPEDVVHMGGLEIEIPTTGGDPEKVFLGVSGAELSTDALAHFLNLLRERGADASIDEYEGGLFTGAGRIDERIGGRVTEAVLRGDSDEIIQQIVDEEWNVLLGLAIPGPLPARCN